MPHNLNLKKIKTNQDPEKLMGALMFRPSFHANDEQIKEVKNWEVDGKYYLVVEVEQKSKHEDERGVSGEFEIVAYKHLKHKSINEMSDKEFGEFQGKQLSKL